MIARWVPLYRHQPDDYRSCPAAMDVMDPDDARLVAGRAVRTGVTRPMFVPRGVYRLVIRGTEHSGLWVFEGGRFIESEYWHKCRTAGISPLGG